MPSSSISRSNARSVRHEGDPEVPRRARGDGRCRSPPARPAGARSRCGTATADPTRRAGGARAGRCRGETSRTYSARAPESRCSATWWRRSKIEKRSSVTTRLISSRSEAASSLGLGLRRRPTRSRRRCSRARRSPARRRRASRGRSGCAPPRSPSAGRRRRARRCRGAATKSSATSRRCSAMLVGPPRHADRART